MASAALRLATFLLGPVPVVTSVPTFTCQQTNSGRCLVMSVCHYYKIVTNPLTFSSTDDYMEAGLH